MTQLTQAEASFVKEQYRVREILASHDISSFYFEMSASGRCSSGDVKVTYKLGENSYQDYVEGNSVDATLQEFLRRKGYTKANAPLCLPSVMPEELGSEPRVKLDLSNELPF